ncbi:molybdopterin-dependent oxidoreductase [Herbaspirillum sp. RV1423]|uniref:molybdopterin-dependent oxidoreductase n=1 Tax=Herbaspirillum sp. RV1423 TaxID=1443993 RepID=UPI000686BFEB|nr:molybdopterin-dependent oxidoreductase [Herbaspirillum sp. RV1423]
MKHFIAAILLAFSSSLAFGAELVLDVSGKITNYTDQKSKLYHFNERDLLSMKKYSIRTSTNWTGVEKFDGFLLADLLDKVGATGSNLEIHCLDGYQYTIPVSDVARYKLILAYERQGKRMGVKELGPLGLIYPKDQYPAELNNAATDAKFTWQVSKIIVK